MEKLTFFSEEQQLPRNRISYYLFNLNNLDKMTLFKCHLKFTSLSKKLIQSSLLKSSLFWFVFLCVAIRYSRNLITAHGMYIQDTVKSCTLYHHSFITAWSQSLIWNLTKSFSIIDYSFIWYSQQLIGCNKSSQPQCAVIDCNSNPITVVVLWQYLFAFYQSMSEYQKSYLETSFGYWHDFSLSCMTEK